MQSEVLSDIIPFTSPVSFNCPVTYPPLLLTLINPDLKPPLPHSILSFSGPMLLEPLLFVPPLARVIGSAAYGCTSNREKDVVLNFWLIGTTPLLSVSLCTSKSRVTNVHLDRLNIYIAAVSYLYIAVLERQNKLTLLLC